MMTQENARVLVRQYIDEMAGIMGVPLVILDHRTREYEYGWVYFYDSKRHQETNDLNDAMGGNAPLVVTRCDGVLHVTGTAYPLDHYLKEYEGYSPK